MTVGAAGLAARRRTGESGARRTRSAYCIGDRSGTSESCLLFHPNLDLARDAWEEMVEAEPEVLVGEARAGRDAEALVALVAQ
jgi:hypothetical protein